MSDAALDKTQIKTDLLAHLSGEDRATDRQVEVTEAAAQPIDQGAHTTDDLSQADAAGDLNRMFEQIDATQQARIDAAKALDMSPTSTVAPGAVVVLDGSSYVVGVPTDQFTSGGVSYAGISTDAPLYEQLKGRSAGESVTFNGTTSTIDAVH